MIIRTIKTNPVTPSTNDITALLGEHITGLKEGSVVVVSSKVAAICEARVVPIGEVNKDELIRQESQYFLPRTLSQYNVSFTITDNRLAAGAGIDESNGNGYYILLPANPQATVNRIREFLATRYKVQHVGVILTDSVSRPMELGVSGVSIAHSGFAAIKRYVGQADIFGRPFKYSVMNVASGLAAAATVTMGEGAELTPLAIIEDVPFVDFQPRDPSPDELAELRYGMSDDLFAPFLQHMPWRRGDKA